MFVPVLSSGGATVAIDKNFTGGVMPANFSLSRIGSATNALYTDTPGATVTSFGVNIARVDSRGLLYEQVTATNFLLNSAVPVTQTTASLGIGVYVLFGNGTGTLTSSAGTATATGLGALALSTPAYQVITVTVAGTVTVTVSGTVNWFDLQNYPVPTSHVITAGATATRSAETLATTIVIPSATTGMFFVKALMSSPGGTASKQSYLGLTDGTSGVVFGFNNNFGQSTTAGMLYTIGAVGSGDGTTMTYPATISGGALWTLTSVQGITNGVVIAPHAGLVVPSDMTTLTVTGGYGTSTNNNAFMGILQKFTMYIGGDASKLASIGATY